jgi:hypothetical protein
MLRNSITQSSIPCTAGKLSRVDLRHAATTPDLIRM